jgi:phage regulator Rha-like protein
MARKSSSPDAELSVPVELIERRIYLVRGHKVMLDADLAELYGVLTKNLNKAVQRNRKRFPSDFMFQLTAEEAETLRFQIGTSKTSGQGGRRYLPYAFTEHGVAMLSAVLHSEQAVQISIAIVRAFVKLREWIVSHTDLALRMEELERAQTEQANHIAAIYQVLDQMAEPAEIPPGRRIGFVTGGKDEGYVSY